MNGATALKVIKSCRKQAPMLIRTFFICVLMQLPSFIIFAQDEVSVILHGKTISKKSIVPDSLNFITLKKKDFQSESSLILLIRQRAYNKVYKRNIEITDSNENQMSLAYESASKPGMYTISLSGAHKEIVQQQIIKIFLEENPVNEMMSIPSRKRFIVELHFK